MKIDERYQYLQRMQHRYRQADRQAKSALLDEMAAHTGMHRKALLRRLTPPQPNLVSLAELLARHGELDLPPGLQAQLAQISFATVRRHLPPLPLAVCRRERLAVQKPGFWSSAEVVFAAKMRVFRLKNRVSKSLRLVHHGGDTPQGEYVYTLQLIDVATGWSGRRAILGRSYLVVADALVYLFAHFPFPVRRIHPDNGSEFSNTHRLTFLRTHYPQVQISRSRPRQPNDNRLVEQKNDTLVRQFLSARRFDTVTQTRYLNTLYAQMDRFYNCIQPVMK